MSPDAADGAPSQLPEPSFEVLVTQLAAQALMQLGQAPNPLTGTPSVAPDRARFTIGLLEIIERTTRGNLSTEQQQFLKDTLGRLNQRLSEVAG